ncbi:hypothetical protein [Persicirhabdus sediminis]|uniref:Uncharacterized protein n=1 Tax=Persicirhabdus sediminis TaxID=454144 RepID=A0A8J7SJ42_9BACT|nr:hypothetical protein [Persicirhabdus sediminis]MBK1790871.1 hypothetical protein [Persicirhabdus sediminis]
MKFSPDWQCAAGARLACEMVMVLRQLSRVGGKKMTASAGGCRHGEMDFQLAA